MDYLSLVEVVRALIADTGRLCTFERLSAVALDANRPWRGPQAPTVAQSVSAYATFVPHTGSDLGLNFISSDLLKRADSVCLVAPNASMDLTGCTSVQDAGQRYAVDWIQTLKPGDTVLLYAIGVKR